MEIKNRTTLDPGVLINNKKYRSYNVSPILISIKNNLFTYLFLVPVDVKPPFQSPWVQYISEVPISFLKTEIEHLTDCTPEHQESFYFNVHYTYYYQLSSFFHFLLVIPFSDKIRCSDLTTLRPTTINLSFILKFFQMSSFYIRS